jgi:hypothetical protein
VSGVVQVDRCLACLGAAVAACVLLVACAGPVPDYGAYRHAALSTATAMISSLAAAELTVQNDLRGGNLFAFTDDSVTNAESARSLALSQKMNQALSEATSALSSLRVAVRQDNRQQMIKALTAVSKALRVFRGLQQSLQ